MRDQRASLLPGLPNVLFLDVRGQEQYSAGGCVGRSSTALVGAQGGAVQHWWACREGQYSAGTAGGGRSLYRGGVSHKYTGAGRKPVWRVRCQRCGSSGAGHKAHLLLASLVPPPVHGKAHLLLESAPHAWHSASKQAEAEAVVAAWPQC